MNILTFFMLWFMLGGGIYLLLSHRYAEVILGIALFSNGINLLLIESGLDNLSQPDPLPQALILTAIVIGFALISFMAAYMCHRIEQHGTDEIPSMVEEDES